MTEYDSFEAFREPGGLQKNVWGLDLASATTVAPTNKYHRVTGTTAIVNITVPWTGFQGDIVFVPTGVFTWTNAGNIALAGTAVVSKALTFSYNALTAKWYPSYIA